MSDTSDVQLSPPPKWPSSAAAAMDASSPASDDSLPAGSSPPLQGGSLPAQQDEAAASDSVPVQLDALNLNPQKEVIPMQTANASTQRQVNEKMVSQKVSLLQIWPYCLLS